jgi:hypothetical protein
MAEQDDLARAEIYGKVVTLRIVADTQSVMSSLVTIGGQESREVWLVLS